MRTVKQLRVGLTALVVCLVPVIAVAAKNCTMENTYVTPHVEVPIESGLNIVFCSTFQIAWNDMKTDIIKDDIHLEKPLAWQKQNEIQKLPLQKKSRLGLSFWEPLPVEISSR